MIYKKHQTQFSKEKTGSQRKSPGGSDAWGESNKYKQLHNDLPYAKHYSRYLNILIHLILSKILWCTFIPICKIGKIDIKKLNNLSTNI